MKIYFVRHGESNSNKLNIYQHPGVELSETGQKQAEFVAKRFENIDIEAIISSPNIRTKQTAEIISAKKNLPIEFSNLITEIKRPSLLVGQKRDDPEMEKIRQQLRDHAEDKSWHHSDEENFYDFKRRIVTFMDHVSKRTEKSLLVITHDVVIRMVFYTLIFKDFDVPKLYDSIEKIMKTKNTGITVFETTLRQDSGQAEKGNWKLITWNDHAHLG